MYNLPHIQHFFFCLNYPCIHQTTVFPYSDSSTSGKYQFIFSLYKLCYPKFQLPCVDLYNVENSVTDISLDIISSRLICGYICIRISFLFNVEWYSVVYPKHMLSIHLCACRHQNASIIAYYK